MWTSDYWTASAWTPEYWTADAGVAPPTGAGGYWTPDDWTADYWTSGYWNHEDPGGPAPEPTGIVRFYPTFRRRRR